MSLRGFGFRWAVAAKSITKNGDELYFIKIYGLEATELETLFIRLKAPDQFVGNSRSENERAMPGGTDKLGLEGCRISGGRRNFMLQRQTSVYQHELACTLRIYTLCHSKREACLSLQVRQAQLTLSVASQYTAYHSCLPRADLLG